MGTQIGTRIEFRANGGQAPGYLVEPPPEKRRGHGLVVIQEWWGLVPHIERVAERLAAEGYTTLAPDLWRGERATSPDQAERLFMALNLAQAEKDLRGAVQELKSRGARKVGVIGFCMGGQLALFAATIAPNDVSAAVDFYGIHPDVKPDFSKLSCPVLGLFGDKDAGVNPEVVRQLVADIEAAGGQIDHTIYPGADHAFFNDARPEVYHPEAAKSAWEKTLAFLDRHLV